MANGDGKKKDKSFLEKADDWIKEKAGARGKKQREESAKAQPAPAPAAAPTERRSTIEQIRQDRQRPKLDPELEPAAFRLGGKGRSSATESKRREKRLGGVPI